MQFIKFAVIVAVLALFVGINDVFADQTGRFRIRPQGNCQKYFSVNNSGDMEGNSRFGRLVDENPNFNLRCSVKVRALNSEGHPIAHRRGRLSYFEYQGSVTGCAETSHRLFRTNKKGIAIFTVTFKGETDRTPLIFFDGFL
jgi:hypothetical protein